MKKTSIVNNYRSENGSIEVITNSSEERIKICDFAGGSNTLYLHKKNLLNLIEILKEVQEDIIKNG